MFSSSRSRSHRESFGYRAGKATSNKKQRSFKDLNRASRIVAQASTQGSPSSQRSPYDPASPLVPSDTASSRPTADIRRPLNSAIVTICVGQAQRLFAAHEDVLSKSPYFAQACREQFFETANKRIELTYEEPEVFSAVLEYLYKGDYTPQIGYDKKRTSFYLATNESRKSTSEVTIQHSGYDVPILKDTAIYVSTLPLSLHLTLLTDRSAPPSVSPSHTSKPSLSRSKASSLACKPASSWHPLASHTATLPPATRAFAPTTSR